MHTLPITLGALERLDKFFVNCIVKIHFNDGIRILDWLSGWSWHKVLVGEPAGGVFLNVSIYFNICHMIDFFFSSKEVYVLAEISNSYTALNFQNLFFYFNKAFTLTYLSNLLLIYFVYMFFKLILLSSIVELMWPTHFFNKKHNISLHRVKYRSFCETFLKTIPTSPYLLTLNVAMFKYLKF